MAVDWIGYSYAILVASGGIIGYAKAARKVSSELALTVMESKTAQGEKTKAPILLRPCRQCPVFGRWTSLWWVSWTGCLPALSRPKENLDIPDCFWNFSWHYGHALLQLREIHACRSDCWCQLADGWEARTEDVRKATRGISERSVTLEMQIKRCFVLNWMH